MRVVGVLRAKKSSPVLQHDARERPQEEGTARAEHITRKNEIQRRVMLLQDASVSCPALRSYLFHLDDDLQRHKPCEDLSSIEWIQNTLAEVSYDYGMTPEQLLRELADDPAKAKKSSLVLHQHAPLGTPAEVPTQETSPLVVVCRTLLQYSRTPLQYSPATLKYSRSILLYSSTTIQYSRTILQCCRMMKVSQIQMAQRTVLHCFRTMLQYSRTMIQYSPTILQSCRAMTQY